MAATVEVGSILGLLLGLQLTICGYVIVTNCHCEVDSILGLLLGLQLTIRGYVIVMDCHCGGGSDFKFVEWIYDLLYVGM